jgi:hypothetical protein
MARPIAGSTANLMPGCCHVSDITYHLSLAITTGRSISIYKKGSPHSSATPPEEQFSLPNPWRTLSNQGRPTKWSIPSLSHQANCVYSEPPIVLQELSHVNRYWLCLHTLLLQQLIMVLIRYHGYTPHDDTLVTKDDQSTPQLHQYLHKGQD